MRARIVVCVLLAAQSASAGPTKLAVPWLEAGPEDDEDVEHLATQLTRELRAQVIADERYDLPADERTFAQVKQHAKCELVKTACLVVVAKELGGDVLISGRMERNVFERNEGYDVSLELIDVASRTRRSWSARAPLESIPTWIQSTMPKAYASLVGRPRLPRPVLAVSSDPVAPAPTMRCNGSAAPGDASAMKGDLPTALVEYEAALRCAYDPALVAKVFLTACNTRNATKARLYYPMLPPRHRNLRQRCVANGIQIP